MANNKPPTQIQKGLISKIIHWSVNNAALTVVLAALMGLWGLQALRSSPLDATPDLSDTQVIVLTEWSGRSPDLVEDQVTFPLSSTLMGAPGVETVRAQSFFGLSFINVIFEESTDLYWARSRVLETLTTLGSALPKDAQPSLGPDATGVGWVYMYALIDKTGKHGLDELRTLQDWKIRYALESVPGVAEVAAIGGFEKEYQVQVDPQRLLTNNLSLEMLADAIRESNADAGAGTLDIAGHEHMIRGRGLIRTQEDLETIPLRISESGAPLLLRDVAQISIGPAARRGLAEWNGQGETVAGIVVMRQGENALKVIEGVKTRLAQLQKELPPEVQIEVAYDRSELILASIDTLTGTLIKELVVVSLVIFLFLLSARSALVPIICLPLAVLLVFIPLAKHGFTLNIMSLGGIAVAIGAMVDASIILVENVHKRLEQKQENEDHKSTLIAAMQEVGPSIFFSLLVIAVAFLPVFTLQATEGRLFKPLALTKTYAMGFAALLAITLTPALIALLVRRPAKKEENHPISRILNRAYTPVVRFVVRHRWGVVATSVLAMVLTVPAAKGLQSEFMPPLNEGVILYMPSSPPGMSVNESSRIVQAMDKKIMEVPEVKTVLGKMGRADTATDPAPLGMAETTIVLKPKSQWRKGLTWEDIIAELDGKLQFPGMPNIWWMPIQTRTEMLTTGIRSPLAVQLFGDNLDELKSAAVNIEEQLSKIKGTRSVFAERATGGFYLDFEIDREKAAQYGLRVAQIQSALQMAVGGKEITQTIEGRQRFGVQLRYAREFRDDPSLFSQVLVHSPTGTPVPITQVAEVNFVSGPPMIRSENGQLTTFVFVDPGNLAISEYVRLGQNALANVVPTGIHTEWTGQYKTIQRLQNRLKLVVPLTLLLVALLLYFNTRSIVETLIVLLAVPFSLIGAFWMLWFLDYQLSVAVWVGLIALAGLDAETGVIMLLYLRMSENRAKNAGRLENFDDLEEVIVEGAAGRMRPKLMTVMTTLIGLSPLLLSTGPGADVMKRIAAPMVGGLTSSFLLELTVYPAIFAIWKGRQFLRSGKSTLPLAYNDDHR